jgi:hypothetical protein
MGSTFLCGALEDSLSIEPPSDTEVAWLILTDGYIAESDKILSIIRKNHRVRVFSLGLGREFDR